MSRMSRSAFLPTSSEPTSFSIRAERAPPRVQAWSTSDAVNQRDQSALLILCARPAAFMTSNMRGVSFEAVPARAERNVDARLEQPADGRNARPELLVRDGVMDDRDPGCPHQ